MTDFKFTYDQNPENFITNTGRLGIGIFQPNYNMQFNKDGKTVGIIDWNGPEMTFSGDLDESVKVFFEFLANSFKGRLEQERVAEREACARIAERSESALHCAFNIRARKENT